jgi:hypothetical protein
VDEVVHEPGGTGDRQQEARRLNCLLHGPDTRSPDRAVESGIRTLDGDFGCHFGAAGWAESTRLA